VQTKGIKNIFNKITAENFPNCDKEMPIQVQEALRTHNRHNKNRTFSQHIVVETLSIENKERTLKPDRKKFQVIYKSKLIRIIAYFSIETLKERKA
jgi:hypothetical protein